MMKKLTLLLLTLGSIYTCVSQISKVNSPVKIIFDTDMGPDYDDIGAIAVLHSLANKGECKILATLASDRYPAVAETIDIFNHYLGQTDIPVGIPDKGAPDFTARNRWNDSIVAKYPLNKINGNDYPLATEVYRKILAGENDKSVTVVTVGFISNLADLLKSGPDKYSPLSGLDLVTLKVKNLVAMAGTFPEGKEFNIFHDWKASKYAFDNWPTPILFSGFDIGNKILTGQQLVQTGSDNSPLVWAYRYNLKTYNPEAQVNRQSWDQTAVLCAVRNPEDYFYVNGPGKFVVLEDGKNIWDSKTNREHYFISHKFPYSEIGNIIDELMMFDPNGN